jgi:peroxiredoxin
MDLGHRIPLLIVFALAFGCGSSSTATSTPTVAELPLVSLVSLTGEQTEIARVAQGRVAVVSLWATWCDACQKELDALNRLDGKTAGRHDAIVIGVAVGEPRATVAAFARRRGLTYLQLVDEDFRFADAIGQRQVPSTLVVDRSGRIVFRGEALDKGGLAALRGALGGP